MLLVAVAKQRRKVTPADVLSEHLLLADGGPFRLLAAVLALRKSQIELLRGASSQDKQFLLRGIEPDALRSKIEAILAEAAPP